MQFAFMDTNGDETQRVDGDAGRMEIGQGARYSTESSLKARGLAAGDDGFIPIDVYCAQHPCIVQDYSCFGSAAHRD